MWISLGKLSNATPGTFKQVSTTQVKCHAVLFQQWPANLGKVFIGDRQTASKTTGVGCLAVLAIPTLNILQSASCTLSSCPDPFDLRNFWYDVDNATEGPLVSYLVW